MLKRTRFSIGFLLCFTALVAIGVSHLITSWKLRAAQSEVAWLKMARDTSWPDPLGISIVSLDSARAGVNPERKIATWHWKVMTPESASLRLRWDASSATSDTLPKIIESNPSSSISLPRGTFEIVATVRESSDKQLMLTCNIGGVEYERAFESGSSVLSHHGFISHIAGVQQTKTGNPRMPFLLSSLRKYSSVPSDGIRIWIEPDTEETEPSDAPKSPVGR